MGRERGPPWPGAGSGAGPGPARRTPDAWMFNGTANGYRHAPLTARVGERMRIWAVAVGPTDGTSLHVVGTRFDTVQKESAYLLRSDGDGADQALDLAPPRAASWRPSSPGRGAIRSSTTP